MNLSTASRELVERARNGDQNAMAIIAEVGKAARRERTSTSRIKSRVAFECIKREINADKMHGEEELPPPPQPLLDGVGNPESFVPCLLRLSKYKDGFMACVVILANGAPLTLQKLTEMAQAAGMHGEDGDVSKQSAGANRARKALRYAHSIQRVRAGAPVKILSSEAGWELGE
jgi:hypothetical protein